MTRCQKILLSILFSAILVVFLISRISIRDLVFVFGSIGLKWIFFAFLFYVLVNFLRANRFRLLLRGKIKLFNFFKIVCLHNFFIDILPFRSGELSYLYLVKKSGIGAGENIGSLMTARFFDYLSIVVLILVSLFFVGRSVYQDSLLAPIFIIVIILFILVTLFILVVFKENFIKNFCYFLIRHSFLRKKIEEAAQMIRALKSARTVIFLFLNSVAIWLSYYTMYFLLLRGLGMVMSFWQVVFVVSFPLFVTILPVQGLAGLGTTETGWLAGLMLMGYSQSAAISSGFVLHIIALAFIFILTIFTLLTPY